MKFEETNGTRDATITFEVTAEFMKDQGMKGVREIGLRHLDSWAIKHGYIRSGEDEPRFVDVTADEDDADLLRSRGLSRWRVLARYRIMTHEEDKVTK